MPLLDDIEDDIEAVHEQIRILGGSGRIEDIIGKVGYRKLIEEVAVGKRSYLVAQRDIATSNLKLLHKVIGMLVQLIEGD